MIVIVDYGMGNLRSILKKLEMIKVKAMISAKIQDIESAEKIILPGVGHFGQGMKNIKEYGLLPILNTKILEKKTPVLGLCLGMQLFAEWSEEGNVAGLGWIQGKIVRFHFDNLPNKFSIPHVGWNTIDVKQDALLLSGIKPKTRFYFTHSYHFEDVEQKYIIATTEYGYNFPSIVKRDNMYGTQFHPEKSHMTGLEIYKNFINYA